MNHVTLMGRLGGDPETRDVNGRTVYNFNIATTEVWFDKQNQKQERTEWHRIVAWEMKAADYLKKGHQVLIEGKIQTREWEDKEGNQQRTTEIQATRIHLLSNGDGGGGASSNQSSGRRQRRQPPPEEQSFDDDDIPF